PRRPGTSRRTPGRVPATGPDPSAYPRVSPCPAPTVRGWEGSYPVGSIPHTCACSAVRSRITARLDHTENRTDWSSGARGTGIAISPNLAHLSAREYAFARGNPGLPGRAARRCLLAPSDQVPGRLPGAYRRARL